MLYTSIIIQDSEFDPYLSLFRVQSKIHFHSKSKEPSGIPQGWEKSSKCKGQGCIHVDVGKRAQSLMALCDTYLHNIIVH